MLLCFDAGEERDDEPARAAMTYALCHCRAAHRIIQIHLQPTARTNSNAQESRARNRSCVSQWTVEFKLTCAREARGCAGGRDHPKQLQVGSSTAHVSTGPSRCVLAARDLAAPLSEGLHAAAHGSVSTEQTSAIRHVPMDSHDMIDGKR
eukprot:3711688-Rhodomonas_salina.2